MRLQSIRSRALSVYESIVHEQLRRVRGEQIKFKERFDIAFFISLFHSTYTYNSQSHSFTCVIISLEELHYYLGCSGNYCLLRKRNKINRIYCQDEIGKQGLIQLISNYENGAFVYKLNFVFPVQHS